MANWQPLSQFSEFAEDFKATGAPAATAPPPQTPPSPTAIATTAAGSTSAMPGTGLPWDDRHTKGFFNAFIETLQIVLSRPSDAFTMMRREGGLGEPLFYALIGGTFGLIVYFAYNLAFQSIGMLGNRPNPFLHMVGTSVGFVFIVILAPIFVALAAFISSAILHVCLMIVGGAKQSYETTFRVVCFSMGSVDPLMIVPICGGLIVVVWRIVLNCIGLARAHETDTGRAVLAVFLPLIVCCGGGLLIAMMFGALGAWSASQH